MPRGIRKLPYMPFYVADYLRDTRCLSLAARGAWMDILCSLWNTDTPGRKTLSLTEWARELGHPLDEVNDALSSIIGRRVCSFKKEENGDLTLISRRMQRDEKARELHCERQHKYRRHRGSLSDGRCDGEVTPENQSQKSESESESEEKKEKSSVGLTPNGALPSVNFTAQAEEVLGFLNEKAGRKYRLREGSGRASVNLEQIIARLKSGATVEQCRAVIAIKCREWKHDEKMQKFLRPATLFSRTNFEQYVGEVGV